MKVPVTLPDSTWWRLSRLAEERDVTVAVLVGDAIQSVLIGAEPPIRLPYRVESERRYEKVTELLVAAMRRDDETMIRILLGRAMRTRENAEMRQAA